MLSSLILLLCLAASAAAVGILVVLFGPVPVKRRVTMVSRIVPMMPVAVGPVAMAGMPVFDPARATFTPALAVPVIPESFGAAPIEPPLPPARKARPVAPLAPQHLRRPRTMPNPLARTRSARGTEPPRHAFDDIENTVESTTRESPMFEDEVTFHQQDEVTFLHARRY